MCDRCADLDYAVADCWRPCYVPRARSTEYIPTTPRGGFSDEDLSAQEKINKLVAIIKRQREEISSLKAIHDRTAQPLKSRNSFEGVE